MDRPDGGYRLIAIDLDGTLLSPLGQVTQRSRQAVRRCLDAGLLVVFATGRNWTESRTVLEAVAHYDCAVFVGGAMVVDTRTGMTLHRTLMDPSLARELCSMLEAQGHAVLALQDTGQAGVDYLVTAGVPLHAELDRWCKLTSATMTFVSDLTTRPHDHTIRVGLVAEPTVVDDLKRELDRVFGSRIYHQSIHVPAYGVEVLEIFDPSVNKWEGILHVARARGVRPDQIVAIGDDVNDMHMVRNAGLGVAMGNAIAPLKALAKRVIKTNAQDGLAEFLDELVDQHLVEPVGGNAPKDWDEAPRPAGGDPAPGET